MPRVVVRRKAQADIAENIAWLKATFGAQAADRWRVGLLSLIPLLEHDPGQFPTAAEAVELGCDLRMALMGRGRHVFRILFTIDDDVVNIHRVRHAAQNWLNPGEL